MTRWPFVIDGRPGVDLSLLDADDRALNRRDLINHLGADAVRDSAEEYQHLVDARLFGLGRRAAGGGRRTRIAGAAAGLHRGGAIGAVHTLLRGAVGAVIRWRNDFDWTGVRLTAAALDRCPCAVPWRMSAADYQPAAGTGPALIGTPAATPWDPQLYDAMRQSGRAVMEERLLDPLLTDLRESRYRA